MSGPQPASDRLGSLGRIAPLSVIASVAGIASFGIAQPLLDLLGRNPEFFIARRFPALDIVLLALALVGVPVVVALIPLSMRGRAPRAAAVAHLVMIGIAGTFLSATLLVALGLSPMAPALFWSLGVGGGAALAWAYQRFQPVRTGLAYLGFAPVVFVVWFLLFTSTSQLVRASSSDLPEAGTIGNPVPVVMVIFDEFPEASLMTSSGDLDEEHFPNFARMAADGVWYRNAVGVRQQTEEALPSILTGKGVSQGSIPTIGDHPFNLFTLLSDGYEVTAVENVTDLCPSYVCSNDSRPREPLGERWNAVLSDLAVVYGHLSLPKAMSDGIPPIDQGWGDFDQQTAEQFDIIERFLEYVQDDRRQEVDRFLDTLDNVGNEPVLRFGHFLYPHHPWDITPDGRIHGAPRPPGRFEVGWGSDDFLVAQGWQRHLLAAQWGDTILGRVLDRLHEAEIYESSLIVVVADHGITISPETEHQRTITDGTIGSVAAVPLFVKYPDGTPGVSPGMVDDARAETVDLVPTIADVVDINVPWRVDGTSLLEVDQRQQRRSSVMVGSHGPVEIGAEDESVRTVAAEKESWFPEGDPFALAPRGWAELIGADAVDRIDDPSVVLTLNQREDLKTYQPGADRVPAYLSGALGVDGEASGAEILAVTIDRKVVAVTRTYEPEGGSARWEAMIDPALLDTPYSEIDVWLVDGTVEDPVFRR